MQNPVSDHRFLDISQFWIINIKRTVGAVTISFVFELTVKLEEVIFQMAFKCLDIHLFAFARTEFFPSQKQILVTNYLIKEVIHV